MKYVFIVIYLLLTLNTIAFATKTIHVFVALCDNENQGIVPVQKILGNGQDPANNLYWGAAFGIKTYFKKSSDWKLVKSWKDPKQHILERILFKHTQKDIYMLADAYDGAQIKQTVIDFLQASAGNKKVPISLDSVTLHFGGASDLVTYIGHDGLMDFDLDLTLKPANTKKKDVIILACYSKKYFSPFIKQSGANPLVWTTGLMAPEAYTLKWALDGWIAGETNQQVRERAAKAYDQYQKCGLRGAMGLLVSGF